MFLTIVLINIVVQAKWYFNGFFKEIPSEVKNPFLNLFSMADLSLYGNTQG